MSKSFEIQFADESEGLREEDLAPPESKTILKPESPISYDHWFNSFAAAPFRIAMAEDDDAYEVPKALQVIQGGLSQRAKDALLDAPQGDAPVSNVVPLFPDEIDLFDASDAYREGRDQVHFSTKYYAELLLNVEDEDLTPEIVAMLLTSRWDRERHPKLFAPETINEIIDLVQNDISPISILKEHDPYIAA